MWGLFADNGMSRQVSCRKEVAKKMKRIKKTGGRYKEASQRDVATARHCMRAFTDAMVLLDKRIMQLQGECNRELEDTRHVGFLNAMLRWGARVASLRMNSSLSFLLRSLISSI